ncbi:MAG TPA: hypothetical protein VFF02_18250 [Anaeromyxobacteraceae bacterium]|nr:hypothetical protein [Anaeromyxobacteraceae bacterium]
MRFATGVVAAVALGGLPSAPLGRPGDGEASPSTVVRLPARQIKVAVEGHIQAKTRADGGVYLLADRRTGETLRLEFVQLSIVSDSGTWKVHDPDRLIDGPAFFACALFHPQGSPEKKLYDVDFELRPHGATLEVTDVLVHKVPRLVDGKWIREERSPGEGSAGKR